MLRRGTQVTGPVTGVHRATDTPAGESAGEAGKTRVRRLILRLAAWPRVSGAKPLSGRVAGRYRLRTGDCRLRFHVRGETVVVEKIGHRSGFYDE